MSHYKKLAKETVVYGFGTIVPRFLNFIVLTPFFTYNVSLTEYGIYTEIYAYAYLLLIILTYGTETAYFKYANDKKFEEKGIYNNICTSILTTSLIFIVLSNIYIPFLYEKIDFGGKIVHLRIFALIIFFDVLAAIPSAKLRQEKKIIKFSIVKIVNVVVNISFVMFLIKILPKIEAADKIEFLNVFKEDKILCILISNLIASIITIFLLIKELIKIRLNINVVILKRVLAYSLPLLIAGISGALNETLDKIVLRFLVEERDTAYELLGIYNASYKMAVIITLFIQMFRFAAEPYFFSIEKEKDSKIVYANILKYFLILILGIFLLITLYIDFVKFYIGPNFRSGLYIVPIVLMANVLYGILININFWFKLSGETKWAVIIVGLGALITIFGNILLIPRYGIAGCAWSHVMSYGGMIICSYILSRNKYKINYNIGRILFYVILTSVIFVLGYYIKIEKIILKTIYSTILLSIYILIVERKERILRNIIKR